MRWPNMILIALSLAAASYAAGPLTGFPFTEENLNYTVNWPTGLGLGDVHMAARHDGPTGWAFTLTVNAAIPGFPVKDTYTSHANGDFCSTEFTRDFSHGSKKSIEKETIDRSHESVIRKTVRNGGGQSEFSISDCMKDALTLLYYARRELGQGRVPPSQQILFGGLYDIGMSYAGEQTIQSGGKPAITDKIVCSVKGPSSTVRFDMYFARDPARTPLLVKVPFAVGSFSMELSREPSREPV